MRKYIFIFLVFVLSSCSDIQSEQYIKDAFLEFPRSFHSLYEAFERDKVFFLNNIVESNDIMTQFYCAQFFQNIEIESLDKISDTDFVVEDIDSKKYLINIIVNDNKITYFRVKEVID